MFVIFFKDSLGSVDLRVVGTTVEGRQIKSEVESATIMELDLSNAESALAMFYADFTGNEPTRLNLNF